MTMTRFSVLAAAGIAILTQSQSSDAQTRTFSLESVQGLRLHHVVAEPVTHQDRKGLRVTMSPEGMRLLEASTGQNQPEFLAVVEGIELANGVIEAEVAGVPGQGAFTGARGFVGLAFRLQNDMRTYDAFYLRPTNGRAEDQERRNRSTQYISHPDWPWFRLRQETPAKYESYVDLMPDAWTKIRIEVRGDKARLFVNDQQQPTLIVNDVKSGPNKSGAVALWIGPGTVAHFRNVTVRPAP
jgi:hypothetical protein